MEKQITILIADDNDMMRETLCMIVSLMNNVKLIREAKNGAEAILLANEISPDIILMDVNMTPVNGFEATRKILKQNSKIKIIGISVHRQASYAKNMLQLGAMGYLIKTSPYTEIMNAINTVAAGEKYIDKEIKNSL
ncbi:MAG TPA: response regulator transcription factor [Chitinophagaceae bacterium]|jgi:DNA-binding NarL/FixJ family response regulator|nr:response regulator transcription factor [Chitinophagaceae bacterium]